MLRRGSPWNGVCRTRSNQPHPSLFKGIVRIGLLSLLLSNVCSAAGGVDPFHAMLRPESSQREVGSRFELTFEVDETARQFNGYEIRLHWNPAVLSLESVREGSLMADACANNFTHLTFTDSTATYSHVLLCGGVSLNGPGVLSLFTFHADAQGSTLVDLVSDPNRTFFDDGIFISPAHPTYPRQVQLFDASVSVGTTSGAESTWKESPFQIRVVPNPVRFDAVLHLEWNDRTGYARTDVGPIVLEISDVSGRSVARWAIKSAQERVPWRAVDEAGARLAAGPYFYRACTAQAVVSGKIVIIP